MNRITLVIACLALIFCSCSRKIVDPGNDSDLAFEMVDCDEVDEFFGKGQESLIRQNGYYACACPSEDSDTVTIIFYLPESMWLSIIIRNATGYDLKNYSGQYGPGAVEIKWDRKSKKGKRVKPGLYIIAFRSEMIPETEAFVVLD
jgi:hypothetical protein